MVVVGIFQTSHNMIIQSPYSGSAASRSWFLDANVITKNNLLPHLKKPHPFSYDLGIKIHPKNSDAGVMICVHGYGSSNRVADVVHSFKNVPDHIIGLNLPDHNIIPGSYDVHKSSFGTINEILPVALEPISGILFSVL